MKFGQALRVLESALPEEMAAPYREHLAALQDSAPPMPTQTVRESSPSTSVPTGGSSLVWLDGATGRGGLDRPGAPRPWADDRRRERESR